MLATQKQNTLKPAPNPPDGSAPKRLTNAYVLARALAARVRICFLPAEAMMTVPVLSVAGIPFFVLETTLLCRQYVILKFLCSIMDFEQP